MRVIKLLVKGSMTDFYERAVARGILAMLNATPYYGSGSNLIEAIVDGQYIEQVANWYREPAYLQPGVGYPPGTLIWYQWQDMP